MKEQPTDAETNERPRVDADPSALPLLTRLNHRGFRLVQLADATGLLALMFAIWFVRYGTQWQAKTSYAASLHLLSFGVLTGLYMLTYYFGGLYEREPRLGRPPVLPRVVRLSLAATGLFAGFEFVATSVATRLGGNADRALPMPLLNLLVVFIFGSVLIAGLRRVAHMLRLGREGPPRVLLVGAPDELAVAMSHMETDGEHVNVVAQASTVMDLSKLTADSGATNVVLLSGRWLDQVSPLLLTQLEARGIHVLLRVTARETMYGLQRVRQIGGMPFTLLHSHTLPQSRVRFKRFTDLIWLALVLPFAVPMLAVTALYVRLVAGAPILFWQERVGVAGKRFQMVKFRTMYVNAEEDGRPQLASREDPRIIPACSWLRATRLDELPQIYNILRGDMSLVGPRPERPELTERFAEIIPGYESRHEVPPGLTGLAQIHGRYHTDPEYKLGYDLQYLVNWSPVLDLEILARTAIVVLLRRI